MATWQQLPSASPCASQASVQTIAKWKISYLSHTYTRLVERITLCVDKGAICITPLLGHQIGLS
jgi:hypothetical protein